MSPSEFRRKDNAYRILYRRYNFGAQKRSLPFQLTFEDFKFLCRQNCVYCNKSPREISLNKTTIKTHGIDRFENNKGYTNLNSYTCCKMCNQMKSNYSFDEFKEQITLIYEKLTPSYI